MDPATGLILSTVLGGLLGLGQGGDSGQDQQFRESFGGAAPDLLNQTSGLGAGIGRALQTRAKRPIALKTRVQTPGKIAGKGLPFAFGLQGTDPGIADIPPLDLPDLDLHRVDTNGATLKQDLNNRLLSEKRNAENDFLAYIQRPDSNPYEVMRLASKAHQYE